MQNQKLSSLSSFKEEKQQVIKHYEMSAHPQGGFFKETYRSPIKDHTEHNLMTVIYYMLTKESPTGVWHTNKSDNMHFHQRGAPLRYDLIDEDGNHEYHILGQDFTQGHTHQLLVKGGVYKATTLLKVQEGKENEVNGEYGLIGEALAPGFDYKDMVMWKEEDLLKKFPQHEKIINRQF